jgi:VIT1/CCC1 family predicted Fe2+/Mn2+ transporter
MHQHAPLISYFRNFIFGVEDGLVSTVGLLSGIAIANVSRETILLSGVVLIFVEAFSMAAGSFLSESSANEFGGQREKTLHDVLIAVTMFVSYFVSGLIPLSAYMVWPVDTAFMYSIAFSVIALFALGAVSARFSRISVAKSGLRMVIVGGLAIAIGIAAGSFVSQL